MTMTVLILFISTFVVVFALGFQSLNVNNGHYKAAFMTSFAIGSGNLMILKIVPNGNLLLMAVYLLTGPLAIVASMWVHKRTLGKKKVSP
jgi:hypothetical protein